MWYTPLSTWYWLMVILHGALAYPRSLNSKLSVAVEAVEGARCTMKHGNAPCDTSTTGGGDGAHGAAHTAANIKALLAGRQLQDGSQARLVRAL